VFVVSADTLEKIKCFSVHAGTNHLGYVYTADAEAAITKACATYNNPSVWDVKAYTITQLTKEK